MKYYFIAYFIRSHGQHENILIQSKGKLLITEFENIFSYRVVVTNFIEVSQAQYNKEDEAYKTLNGDKIILTGF